MRAATIHDLTVTLSKLKEAELEVTELKVLRFLLGVTRREHG